MIRLISKEVFVGAVVGAAGGYLPGQMLWNNLGSSLANGQSAYDSARDRVVALGGSGTWEFDGQTWAVASPLQSPPNISRVLGYDPIRERIVMHGSPAETWEYDGVTWTQVSPPGVGPQFASTNLVWHRGRGAVVVLDGTRELWEWDGAAWRLLDPGTTLSTGLASGLSYSTLCYDMDRDMLVVFGAVHITPGPIFGTPVTVTWEWDAVNGWQQIAGVGGPLASSRALYYDQGRRMQVLAVASGAVEQIWERSGSAPWVQKNTAPPMPSLPAHMVFDSRRSRFVLPNNQGDTWTYAAVVPATYAANGNGCAGTLGEPRLATAEPWTLPWLGSTMHIEVEGVPQSVAILATGLDDRLAGATPLPLDLSSLGMPGCSLRTAPDVVTFGLGAGTSVGFAVPVPNRLPLVSLRFYQQALVLDPAANAAGLVLSNSIAARPGTW